MIFYLDLELVLRFRVQSASINHMIRRFRGCSSVGRAPDLHSGGRRFDPDQLHQRLVKRNELDGPVAQLARAHP